MIELLVSHAKEEEFNIVNVFMNVSTWKWERPRFIYTKNLYQVMRRVKGRFHSLIILELNMALG